MSMNNESETDMSYDVYPKGGTPLSNLFSCCFPKKVDEESSKNRSMNVESSEKKKTKTKEVTFEDPDKSESGLVYFDLPDLDEEAEQEAEEERKQQQQQQLHAPPLVMEFWRFIFSILMLDWLRKNPQQRHIKNE